uniref:DUF1796 family putative cysteine peptidase n=1 Tax=uncultured Mailhella sp. TaxID=1981031 RepID=UPI002615C857
HTHTASRNAAGRSFLETTHFDLIVSLGVNCGAAWYLRDFGLRTASFPFDWLRGATFKRHIELILNDFKGFFEKDKLKKIAANEHNDFYEDKESGFISLHDFKKDVPLDVAYPEVIKKYQRRIKRLYDSAGDARYVLFVWWGIEGESISDEDMIDAQKMLSQKFNKNVYLLMIQNDNTISTIEETCPNIFITNITAPIDNSKGVKGDEAIGSVIFSRIKLLRQRRAKISSQCKKILIQIVCAFVPIRSVRYRVRVMLKQKILGQDA